ncbi:MAG: CoB--CoM heterodisulfide reductase iron-sulfur subunit A family protein [Thermodesulfobacteriota bacterium]
MKTECKVGVYVCNCGTNIAKMVDCDAVAEYAKTQPGVVVCKAYKYMCSNPGQEMIIKDVQELKLDRVVVAACSPRMHEPTFRGAIEKAGLNPYFFEMANIREQCSWVHENKEQATEKAKALTCAAVRRVQRHEPFERQSVPMHPATLVIGGGIAGLTAAVELSGAGQPVYLVEKDDHLGGNVARIDLTSPYLDSARDLLAERIAQVTRHPKVTVLLRSEVESISGYIGNFKVVAKTEGGGSSQFDVGSIIVCTGFQEFDASKTSRYGYSTLPNVITSYELEKMLREGQVHTKDGRAPKYVTLVNCVGSRSKETHPYCSRVCCMTALKYGHEIRSAVPGVKITNLYTDMNAFGKGCEEFYRRSAEKGTVFMMYDKWQRGKVRVASKDDGCELLMVVKELLSGEEVEIPSDLIVLMVGMEPRPDSGKVARLVNISRDRDGWFIESHPKLDPVATTTDGVFIAGACQSPKDIPETVAQARATAARILAKICQGQIWVEPVYAEINENACSGCRMCNELCPYSAIEYDPVKKRSSIISVMCKACGTCVAACPSGAIKARHFTDQQIFEQIEGVLEWASSHV